MKIFNKSRKELRVTSNALLRKIKHSSIRGWSPSGYRLSTIDLKGGYFLVARDRGTKYQVIALKQLGADSKLTFFMRPPGKVGSIEYHGESPRDLLVLLRYLKISEKHRQEWYISQQRGNDPYTSVHHKVTL